MIQVKQNSNSNYSMKGMCSSNNVSGEHIESTIKTGLKLSERALMKLRTILTQYFCVKKA